MGRSREAWTFSSISSHDRLIPAFGDAGHPERLDQASPPRKRGTIDRARGDALDKGFLDYRGERLLSHPPAAREKPGK